MFLLLKGHRLGEVRSRREHSYLAAEQLPKHLLQGTNVLQTGVVTMVKDEEAFVVAVDWKCVEIPLIPGEPKRVSNRGSLADVEHARRLPGPAPSIAG